jgi:Zn2+/Cd2+-exporting ATPase
MSFKKQYIPALLSAFMLVTGLIFNYVRVDLFSERIQLFWYVSAYVLVGGPVVKRAVEELIRLDFANEFFLMSVATIGAFAIGEFAEAVAVMLFYEVGELLQKDAVDRARGNIKALLDLRPQTATLKKNGEWINVNPEFVSIGDLLMVKPGEKFPLDGKLISESATVNTAAITGESRPKRIYEGGKVLAGSINIDGVSEMQVTRAFSDSSLSRILKLVEVANLRKAPTERFMRRFARYYTPLVMAMALLITLLPALLVESYQFSDWVYRAFVFLVIACPCALYVSIPLGYFGGIGAASKNGILFKGADYLDRIRDLHTILIDKTGTLTKGSFSVTDVRPVGIKIEELVHLTAALESRSTHPVARAITGYAGILENVPEIERVTEIPAMGMEGSVNGRNVVSGNKKLMESSGIEISAETGNIPYTIIHTAIDNKYAGYFVLADEIHGDSKAAVEKLHRLGVKEVVMLSGDKDRVTKAVASDLGIDHAHGDLLPEEKAAIVKEYVGREKGVVAFAGDGINDAPSIALADVGIAMGAMGSDLAIETADVVIQTDQPSKIAKAVQIARETSQIVRQNIWMVFIVKALFLGLGAMGIAGMWEAVFADMGVALAAIFNAIRIQRKKF